MRSIELGWLNRRDKDLPLPQFTFVPNLKGCGGYYARPDRRVHFVNERGLSLRNGLIVCGQHTDTLEVANTIAHEWRHHWQLFHVGLKDSPTQFDTSVDYHLAIKKFFKDRLELDALLFSHHIAPSPTSAYWMELIKCQK